MTRDTGQGLAELRRGRIWSFGTLDGTGAEVEPVGVYLREVQAAGCVEATLRSYGLDLLRWFRFLWAVEVSWDRATRTEARDFSRWLQVADKPAGRGSAAPFGATPNAVTGRSGPGPRYAARTVAHCEKVLRAFYDVHRRCGSGPAVNPSPLAGQRIGGRPNAHHNPVRPFRNERVGLYRPKVPRRVPRAIPDERSTSCSRRCPVIGTGHWSPSTSRPEPAPRSCSARPGRTPTPVSS